MARIRTTALCLSASALLLVSACGENGPGFLKRGGESDDTTAGAPSSVRLVDRDVEAPEVFQITDGGLWDGRPSLGGVWVAHRDVTDPERVIIRNETNQKFVIGALFRRERETPGPAFQVSSDAAEALGLLAGSPATLNVTALRRQEVPIADETPATDITGGEIETSALDGDETVATASAAIAAAEAVAEPTPVQTSSLSKPYIQIGLFSVEANANNTGEQMRREGMVPVIRRGEANGKPYWRVLVGPAATSAERSDLLKNVKALGFGDAYFVSN